MSLSLLTSPEAVHLALDEFDSLGEEEFLRRYGYGRSRSYFIIRDGKRYDSKAIVGVAVGKQYPQRGPLRADEFSGGEQTVQTKLKQLGFEVVSPGAADSSPRAEFSSNEALLVITEIWGEPVVPPTKYLAVWRTKSGRELALQLDQRSARVWIEAPPPSLPGVSVQREYGPKDSRNSNLKANAPCLAQPNFAWYTALSNAEALSLLLDWYGNLPSLVLNQEELERLRVAFLREMPDFQSFADSGHTYLEHERDYKDELRMLFLADVLPLAEKARQSSDAAHALTAALHSILTRKLKSTGRPQNLIRWQVVDRLKPGDKSMTERLGRALADLLIENDNQISRLERFITVVGLELQKAGVSGPNGIARLLGSCALMLMDPETFVAIRTELFEKSVNSLTGTRFPTYSDEPGRVRVSMDLAERLRSYLADVWHWRPKDLIDIQSFLWVSQMYDAPNQEIDDTSAEPPELIATEVQIPAYSIDDAMNGLFMDRSKFERILAVWGAKKNLVLQGAPGVGKSFVARRLAYTLLGEKDPSRLETVQFHQSYGYEDFVQGYRPTESGSFALRDGVFFRFCRRALSDPNRRYVFIIDEINRGNLSKVFGELMLLIEPDKRGPEWAARLAYSSEDDAPFYVPDNLFIIGMMNTADRSLSLVDYALRRRFAFVTLEPAFSDPKFPEHLAAAGVTGSLIGQIVDGMMQVNAAIAEDRLNLGPGFCIGHSFFVPTSNSPTVEWYQRVIDTEIRPLIEEYWFDDQSKAAAWCERLLRAQ
ncbi:AAA family ATPase [Microvirga sp. KLBC 81]|uniref:AAA family ATPase n=1 Tax=Microvirga sp. KLBC 81 TaxID=1862707 RepID=UPI001403F8FA|nr:AAA family ATPase [Microvirga sp. KLBC 81]